MAKIKLIAIADDSFQHEQGLQYVRDMPRDSGMLFDFKRPRVLSFWMRNTYMPLDIAFIDNKGVIVKAERMVPLSLRTVSSGSPCVMALEFNAGALGERDDLVGKKMTIDRDNNEAVIE